jgi:hypothetical protein
VNTTQMLIVVTLVSIIIWALVFELILAVFS